MRKQYSYENLNFTIGGRKTEINFNEILYLESVNNYTICKLQDGTEMLSSKPIGVYEKVLKDFIYFVRTHRSFIVNLSNIDDLEFNCRGGKVQVGEKEFEISRRKVAEFRKKYKDFRLMQNIA